MKKKLYLITTILLSAAALSLSSCLKDSRYVDFSKAGNVVDFPLQTFGSDAITETPDTDANGTIVRQFSVDVATASPTKTATTVTLAVDNSIVTKYNATGGPVTYLPMPTNAYKFTTTTVTVPAGQQYAVVSVTFYKNLLDPSKSYMLPIKIVSAPGMTVSGNMGIHYYHFIGNDFAGSFDLNFTRWGVSGDTTGTPDNDHIDDGAVTFLPVDPTTFKMPSGYYTGITYTVTFTKTGSGSSATYSNFAVVFTADDIQSFFTDPGAGVVLVLPPVFDPAVDPSTQYTYAQAIKLFRFYYTTASRSVIDKYTKL